MAQGTQAQRDACTGDAMRLCSQFIPDAGRTGACLNSKKAQLSPACRAVFGGSTARKAKARTKHKTKTKVAKKKSHRRSSRHLSSAVVPAQAGTTDRAEWQPTPYSDSTSMKPIRPGCCR